MTQRVVNYTYGTGNPVLPDGSIDVRDGIDNLQSFDVFMNADEDTYNQRDGEIVPTVAGAIRSTGFKPGTGDFTTGFTVLPGQYNTSWYDPVSKNWYSYLGVIPSPSGHPVAPGASPVGDSVWAPRTDELLRSELNDVDGASLVGQATYSQIRAYDGVAERFDCVGRANVFDGAQGTFTLDTSDTSTQDDDGYCLVDALGRRWKRIGFSSIDPAWYGAVSDYDSTTKAGTSSSQAFYKAISLAAAGVTPFWQDGKTFKEVCKVVRPKAGNYKFTTSVPIPSGVIVDLNQSLIGGDGFTDSDCEAFVTGYIDTDGVLKSNLALGDEVGRVIGAQLINWRAKYLKKFFHAKNFNEGSICQQGYASDVQQVIKGSRCFYGAFRSCISRGAAGGTLLPAFDFDLFNNIMDLDGLVAASRQNLQRISGGANSLHVRNQSYEGGGTGLTVTGEVYPALFSCNYFEALTAKGLDMSDPSTKRSVVVDNNWFYNMPIGVHGASLLGGHIGCGNHFLDCGINVHISDNVSTVTVDIPPYRMPDSASLKPIFPVDKYVLGQAVDVRYRVHNFSAATGETLAAQNYAGDRPMDMPYSGKQGYVPGKVAFCDVARVAGSGSSFSVIVDSKISFDDYVMYSFRLRVADNLADRTVSGHGYGDIIVVDHNTGTPITVTASNVGGYLRLTLGTFDGVSFACEGVLRHM